MMLELHPMVNHPTREHAEIILQWNLLLQIKIMFRTTMVPKLRCRNKLEGKMIFCHRLLQVGLSPFVRMNIIVMELDRTTLLTLCTNPEKGHWEIKSTDRRFGSKLLYLENSLQLLLPWNTTVLRLTKMSFSLFGYQTEGREFREFRTLRDGAQSHTINLVNIRLEKCNWPIKTPNVPPLMKLSDYPIIGNDREPSPQLHRVNISSGIYKDYRIMQTKCFHLTTEPVWMGGDFGPIGETSLGYVP